LAQQIALLTRKTDNPYVFSCESASGHVVDPRASHEKAMLDAGITNLTTHGLRRSFSLLGEAAGAPAGAIRQVMGHKPGDVAEGYRPRSVDALMPYLTKIEAYILERAGIVFDAGLKVGRLHAVA
jgi:integrase